MIIETGNGHVGVDDVGTGLPVVLLHGFPHTRALWAQQVASLSMRARCIAPDLRGFGASVVDAPWTMEQYASDVRALLDALEIERAVLAGLSMGGYVAMACLRAFPERVIGLALLDTQAGADDDAARAKRDALITQVRARGVDAVVDAMLPGMLGKTTRSQRPDVVADVESMMREATPEGIVGALQAMRDRPDSTETIRTVQVPTMIIVGDEDVLTPPAKSQALAALLPPGTVCRLDVIVGSGHVSCMERPSAVNYALAEFVELVQSR